MPRRGWFERRLLLALILFSLVPSLLLVALGTVVLREAASLQSTPAGWARLAETGRDLLELADGSGDPQLGEAAARHREELAGSLQQAQRWAYLNRRLLEVLPWLAVGFLIVLAGLALRSARGIARDLAHPLRELAGWAGHVARGEPLPPPGEAEAGRDEIGQLRHSFRTMARELELSRARALETARIRASVALARGVSHELKNALTPLRLAVRALQGNPSIAASCEEPLEVIDAESRRLEELARAFAQFGRIPEGAPSQIDLAELLGYLARTHLPPAIRREIEVPEDLPSITGHHDALARAFANLILNAVEALGEAGGRVSITAGAAGAARVEVRIADSGPGLPPGAEDRIWDPDFTTKARGTGLGLSLVRQTVHAHGGDVSARQGADGGAEFRVLLPVEPGARRPAELPDPPSFTSIGA